MKGIYNTVGLVLSRMRFDAKRHLTAASAVAILMASFLTFNAVAAGLDEGIRGTIRDEGLDTLQLTLRPLGPAGQDDGQAVDLGAISSWEGVLSASGRYAEPTGIVVEGGTTGGFMGRPGGPGGMVNATQEIVLVRVDADAESALVNTTAVQPRQGFGGRGFAATEYRVTEGRWIEHESEAVVSSNLVDQGYALGSTFTHAGGSWDIVGVVSGSHPANVAPQGVFSGGQVIVDGSGDTALGALVLVRDDYDAVQGVTQAIIDEYPQAAFGLEARLADLEAQNYDAERTKDVLAAASRLVAAAGVATVFAMSLFLLIGERRVFGTLSSVGFGRPRLSSYMNQKMIYVTMIGVLFGAILGWLVLRFIPAPEVSFAFQPVIDRGAWFLTSLQTLAAAIAGSLVAYLMTIRQDPIAALRAVE